MKRILLALALAGSALLGSVLTTAATTPSAESTYRTGFLNCAIVDEAVKMGVDPQVKIPETRLACAIFRQQFRFQR